MAHQVPDQVLAWLYSVLHEYNDPQRTYSDAARTLAAYPSIAPRTQVHTNEYGREALLLTLSGTLPVTFRGAVYRFPLQIWIPHAYPNEAPIVYVIPGKDMAIRPGQHVGVDGRVYHPYLRDWTQVRDRANVVEWLDILQRVFAKEPPVVGKTQVLPQQQLSGPTGQNAQGPPQLPPKQRPGSIPVPADSISAATPPPPPRPPKPGDNSSGHNTPLRDLTRDGPPLPPLPHERPSDQQRNSAQYAQPYTITPPRGLTQQIPSHQSDFMNGRPSEQLRPSVNQYQQQFRPGRDGNSPVSPISSATGYSEVPERTSFSNVPQRPNFYQPQPIHAQGSQFVQQHGQVQPSQSLAYNQQKQPTQAPPDLLTDPFEIAMPSQPAHNQPAPPIPPNPEKEHLLQALSATLTEQAQKKVNQNLAARTALLAQQAALQSAYAKLQGELRQLAQLGQTLDVNERILHKAISDCDAATAATKNKPPPPIDDVLVAPSLVAQQLWTLCAEEAAGKEAMYVLQQAVDRGRVGADVFVRVMRSLGREAFLRKATMRKCAKGLGLEMKGVNGA
ncbi:Hypothetical protein R9X50_00527200 [Acrodontium crateriforme]|uniref:UEV-domain-containing protein n=1 Tax=Acrodontium crateriforme TaxID=150365 RepID=A0AAQ3M6U6_9PEZI|nr:Hypothetical protein R9X50_00527200 [Acrodontium crateriforme]